MLNIIKDLYKLNRCLLGKGYDQALEYLKKIIDLEIIEIPSGTKVGNWVVPPEWEVKDAWVKYKGKKIVDYKKNPLSLVVYSKPFKGKVSLEELKKHLYVSDERPKDFPYEYKFYERDWGICMPKEKVIEEEGEICQDGTCYPELNTKLKIEGFVPPKKKTKDLLKKGKYEVFIDTSFKKGKLKIGVHTIKSKAKNRLNKEILLFAHLDHPFQANDNLSGVACLVDLAKKLKNCRYDIKIIFCPETIGSIAYVFTQDISKVDWMLALDCVGNDNTLLIQKSFNRSDKLNLAAHLAITTLGISYRKAEFRFLIGSDEYVFNDPEIGIPGLMISRYPYPEYHTSADTPKIIKEKNLKEVQKFILKLIEIMEKNCRPKRKFKGPLFRSGIKAQTFNRQFNRNLDYFIYLMDGKKDLIELCCYSGVDFDYAYQLLKKMKNENLCSFVSQKRK